MEKNQTIRQLSIIDSDYLNYLIQSVIDDPLRFPLKRRAFVGRQWTTITITEAQRRIEIKEYFSNLNPDK